MELIGVIILLVALTGAIVFLWRSTPPKNKTPVEPSADEDESIKTRLVDIPPGGSL
jgi:hypothetical protein